MQPRHLISTATRWSSTFQRSLHVKSWALPFAPGGTLKARLPKPCALTVYPLDPHSNDWQTAHVEFHVIADPPDAFLSEDHARKVLDAFAPTVVSDREPGRNFLQLETAPDSAPTALARAFHALRRWIGGPFRGDRPVFDARVHLRVGVPGKLDVDVELDHGGPVHLAGPLEGDVRIATRSAAVHAAKLKSEHVDIDVDDGDVRAGVVHGSVRVRSRAGHVDMRRVQGPVLAVDSHEGDVQLRAVYADYASVRARDGAVRLGGAHGYTRVRTRAGNVEVAGVQGRLDVETDAGDVEARLAEPQLVTVRSRRGDVRVGLPDGLRAHLLVEGGKSVEVGADVGLDVQEGAGALRGIVKGVVGLGGGKAEVGGGVEEGVASVHARAPGGEVAVVRQGWAPAIGLGAGSEARIERFPRWVGDEEENVA